jgi:Protein of unknown function (DUF2917)
MTCKLSHRTRALGLSQARSLQVRRAGHLTVLGGPAWLTVDGEGQDRVLQPGEALRLESGHRLVIEPWRSGDNNRLLWQPAARTLAGARRPGWRWWPRGLSAPAA